MNLPNGWKYTKLSEIGSFSKGSGIKREDANSGNIPAVRYGEIYTVHNEYIKDFYSFISEDVAKNSVLLKKGDLLFSCSGETKEDIGKCVAFVSDCTAYAGGDIIILRPQVSCDSKFLGFLCNSYFVNRQRYKYAQGDSIVHISVESLGKVKFMLPPLAEQRKIAEVLCTQDRLISLKEKLLEQKRRQKKWLMQTLLEVPHEGNEHAEKFSIGGVVIDKSGWKKEKLGNVCDNFTGLTYSPKDVQENGKLVLRSSNIVDGLLEFKNNVFVNMKVPKRVIVRENDILVCVRNGSKSLIGKSALITKDAAGMAFGAFMTILRAKNIYQIFLFYLWQSKFLQDQIKISMGATINQITNADIQNFTVFLPTLPEQKIIAQVLSAADKEIDLLKQEIELQKQKKKALAQLLLSGTVRVK
ncbi:MAG: restriction endonuclease subunit S [Treponema sp.]|nr:restriction endonuclease subunit S [Treponema sp.]